MKERSRNRLAVERGRYDALDLNLRSLDVFVQIAECGGMSQAARRMGLTQSAVSQMMANLEQSLGVQLFDRQMRPIALTASGSVLLEKARDLLSSARDIIQAARQPATKALPKLNISLVETIAGTIGLELVSGIQGLAALWSIHAGLHSLHSKSLKTREVDIVVSPDPLEDEPNLERHRILTEQLIVVLPNSFEGEAFDLASLAQERDLVRLSGRTMLGRQIERHFRRLKIDPRGRVEFDDPEAVMAMVAESLGWAILTPMCSLLGRSFWPQLQFVPMPGPAISRDIYVLAREKELGDIPKKVAETARASVRKLFDAELAPRYPWMADGFSVPGAPGKGKSSFKVKAAVFPKAAAQPSTSSVRQLPSRGSAPLGKLARNS